MSRLFVGGITNATREDIAEVFEPIGAVTDIRLLGGFGFVEYEKAEDAERAITELNGKEVAGAPISVQQAKSRSEDRRGMQRDEPVQRGFQIEVLNVPEGVAWQDLKDFGRNAGNVRYSNVIRSKNLGILEYETKDEADEAIRVLSETPLNEQTVEVRHSEGPPPREFGGPRRGRGGFRGGRDFRGRGGGFRGRGGRGRGGGWNDRGPRRDGGWNDRAPRNDAAPEGDQGSWNDRSERDNRNGTDSENQSAW